MIGAMVGCERTREEMMEDWAQRDSEESLE